MPFLYSIFVLLAFVGCKSRLPNPEASDQLYGVLLSKAAAAEKEAESAEAEVKSKEVELKGMDGKIGLRNYTMGQMFAAQKRAASLRQQAEYYKVRAQKRKIYIQEAYEVAFQKDQEWPTEAIKADYSAYSSGEKLRSVSRNWQQRVPKSSRYDKPAPEVAKPEKEEAPKH